MTGAHPRPSHACARTRVCVCWTGGEDGGEEEKPRSAAAKGTTVHGGVNWMDRL